MKRPLLSLPLAVLALAAGCGGSGGDPDADPAAIAPARAPLYFEASIKSDKDVEAIAKKLSGTENPSAELKKAFEKAVNEDGGNLKWDRDFKPWIGDRIGVFITSLNAEGEDADAALVAPTDDPDKAQEFLDKQLRSKDGKDQPPKVSKRKYKDVEYNVDTADDTAVAILDEYALIGTEQAVKGGIDAQKGEGLADADSFKKARDQVEDDAVAFGYVKVSTLLGSLGQQGAALRPLLGQSGDTVAFSIDAEDDAITAQSAAIGVKGGASAGPGEVLATVPAEAWLAGGSADIGAQFEKQLQQLSQLGGLGGVDVNQALEQFKSQTGVDVREDLLSWMGDAAIYVSGKEASDIGGALVVKSKDPAKSEAAIADIQRLIRKLGQGQVSAKPLSGSADVDRGIEITATGLPVPVSLAAAGDRFVIAVGAGTLEEALKPSQALGDAPAFKDAAGTLDDGVKPQFFANLEPVGQLLDSTGALQGQGAEAERFRKALDQLTTIVAGSKRDGDVQRGQLVVGVK
jgi:hypothetical protein